MLPSQSKRAVPTCVHFGMRAHQLTTGFRVVLLITVAIRDVVRHAAQGAGAAAGNHVAGKKRQYGAQHREANGMVALGLHDVETVFFDGLQVTSSSSTRCWWPAICVH